MPQNKKINQFDVYSADGQAVEKLTLDEKIFGVHDVKPEVIHELINSVLSQSRRPIASTKNRGEVRGGGRKPWKQKGTGRARVGSIRSPLWRGGGVIFGPTSARNFAKRINKKTKRLGLLGILSGFAAEGKILFLKDFELAEPKTKLLNQKFSELRKKFDFLGKKLLVISAKDKNIFIAARNLPNVEVRRVNNLSAIDLLKADSLIILKNAVEEFNYFAK